MKIKNTVSAKNIILNKNIKAVFPKSTKKITVSKNGNFKLIERKNHSNCGKELYNE